VGTRKRSEKAFFHSSQVRNTISMLYNAGGVRLTTFDEIKKELVDFYSNLFGKEDANVTGVSIEKLQCLFRRKLSSDQHHSLLAEVAHEDIKRVMFSYNGSKAPDPDGVSADFYKKSWGVMGVDVTEAVLHFFQNGKILKAINSTSITLVPEVRNASKALDSRPISCCFILYKCISKSWLIEQDMFCLALLVQINQLLCTVEG